jgi:hypothetical protein
MNKYHKIQTVFLRDPANRYRTLLDGQYALPEFKYLADLNWVFTEKVDGTNIRIMFDGEKITFGGKTDRAELPKPLLEKLTQRFDGRGEQFSDQFPKGVCLYGEGYGHKIQKGGSYRPDQDFVLFDVKIGGIWLERGNVSDIATCLTLETVPIVGVGTLREAVDKTSNGFVSAWGNFYAEGLVARPELELVSRRGHRIITKIKYKDFPHE